MILAFIALGSNLAGRFSSPKAAVQAAIAALRSVDIQVLASSRLYHSAVECLFKEKPDIVVIATTTKSHFSLVKLACRLKIKMIICEKPLCRNAKEAALLARAVKASGSVFVLNYQRRFYPLFERIRRDVARKAIGDVQHVAA